MKLCCRVFSVVTMLVQASELHIRSMSLLCYDMSMQVSMCVFIENTTNLGLAYCRPAVL